MRYIFHHVHLRVRIETIIFLKNAYWRTGYMTKPVNKANGLLFIYDLL